MRRHFYERVVFFPIDAANASKVVIVVVSGSDERGVGWNVLEPANKLENAEINVLFAFTGSAIRCAQCDTSSIEDDGDDLDCIRYPPSATECSPDLQHCIAVAKYNFRGTTCSLLRASSFPFSLLNINGQCIEIRLVIHRRSCDRSFLSYVRNLSPEIDIWSLICKENMWFT